MDRTAPPRVAVCEDDVLCQAALQRALAGAFCPTLCADGEALLARLPQQTFDLVLLDLRLGGRLDGFAVLARLRRDWPQLPVVIYSGATEHASVVRAMRLGAADYILKGGEPAALRDQLRPLCAAPAVPAAAATAAMVGGAPAMAALRQTLARIARFDGNVVVQGESGVGKELVAQALRQPGAPFVPVDAATLADATAASALFGHERGAFTGADGGRVGLLEEAHGGVLYLDEVANLPLDVQAKLLRALQEKEVVRLGSSRRRRAAFRTVCATHRDLEAMARGGTFRADLLARLSVFVVTVPPLRQRLADLPALVDHLWARQGGRPGQLGAAVLAALGRYGWPGNVRELDNVLRYVRAMSDGGAVHVGHLPAKVTDADITFDADANADANAEANVDANADADGAAPASAGAWSAQLRAFERGTLAAAYACARGNISEVARALHLDRSSLHARLVAYGIHRPRPRPPTTR